MNIYIDYTAVIDIEKETGTYTGAGNYTRELIRTLTEGGTDFRIILYHGYIPEKECEKRLLSDESKLVRCDSITEHVFYGCDVLLFPAVTGRILAKACKIRKKQKDLKIYAVIHDRQHNLASFDPVDRYFYEGIYRFVPLLFAKFVIKKLVYNCSYPRWIKSVDKVFTVSNDTLQALNHKNLKQVFCYYQASSVSDMVPGKRPQQDVPKEYILFVSGERPEKNLVRALLAYEAFCKDTDTDCSLCITGIEESKLRRIAARLSLSRDFLDAHIRAYGYVDTGELAYLYQNCRYLLFVSKGEGFGLPVLEALLCGRTVLCSRQSSIPEVAGSILYYVDAFSVNSIKNGMLYLNDDKNLLYRQKLAEKKKTIIEQQIELDKCVLMNEITGKRKVSQ